MNINNVSGIMTNYNMSSMLQNLNSSDPTANVPLVSSIDSYLKDNTDSMNFKGVSQATQLQNLFNTVDPSSSITNNVGQSPKLSMSDLQNNMDLNLLGQFNGNMYSNGASPIIDNSVLEVYTSLENGTFKPSTTSITTSNPISLYTNVNAMQNQLQTSGNFLSVTA